MPLQFHCLYLDYMKRLALLPGRQLLEAMEVLASGRIARPEIDRFHTKKALPGSLARQLRKFKGRLERSSSTSDHETQYAKTGSGDSRGLRNCVCKRDVELVLRVFRVERTQIVTKIDCLGSR
jgi:hypothetical protein